MSREAWVGRILEEGIEKKDLETSVDTCDTYLIDSSAQFIKQYHFRSKIIVV